MSDQPRTPSEALDRAFLQSLGESAEAHEAWIRHVVTLCSGGLTLLVSLQSTYVPQSPRFGFLLLICWTGLALSTLCGVVALYSRAQTKMDIASGIHRNRQTLGDLEAFRKAMSLPAQRVRWYFPFAKKVMFVSFVISLVCLTVFASLNLS